jgi:hypothetical protein
VSERCLLAVVQTYLQSFHPDVRIWEERPEVHGLRVTEGLRHTVLDAVQAGVSDLRRSGDVLVFTTNGELAYREAGIELMNSSHPLVRTAVLGIRQQLADPIARVGRAMLSVCPDESEIAAGTYFVVVWSQVVEGMRSRQVLEPIAWSTGRECVMDAEVGERLLHLVIEEGTDWSGLEGDEYMSDTLWARRSNYFSDSRF